MDVPPARSAARRREARLRRTVRSQRRFIEMLAHDVRSPISAAVLRAQALALDGDDETNAALAAMEDMLQDLNRSVGTLVEGMRLLWAAPRLDRQRVNPRMAVARALTSVRRRAERRQIRLDDESAGTPTTMSADPDRLETLVMWMAAVGIRLTRTGGAIRLGFESDGTTATFRVESTAALADAQTLAAARRDFLHGRTVEGTDVAVGFGVAVAVRLANLHDGRFTAEDDGKPLGHCRLTLLAHLPVKATHDDAGSPSPGSRLHGLEAPAR